VLASFNGVDGQSPVASPVQGVDGNFYGTVPQAEPNSSSAYGTVYKVTPAGEFTTLYSFCSLPNCIDGRQPEAGLVVGPDGNLYGTTAAGGVNVGSCEGPGCGTVFKITPTGELTTLYSFCSLKHCVDGLFPNTALVLGSDGNFYGTTYDGGAKGRGTVFKITATGELTTLYSFCSLKHCADGSTPTAALIQAENGNFYGTTYDGGTVKCSYFQTAFGCGTIFEITPSGQLTTLYSFATDAGLLQQPLVQAANGNFYGTSLNGGTSANSGACNGYGCGTVFEITSSGKLHTLYNFCTQEFCPDGALPMAGLYQATDGNLYGSTSTSGVNAIGTIFSMTPAGELNTLYDFVNDGKGYNPQGTLMQGTDGNFYGIANGGGAENQGTVFQLSTGLSPFVKTVPAGGAIGSQVIIMGNNLTAATAVSFDGTTAAFNVVSNTEITATVPEGAMTGTVEVTTPKKILKSNARFVVTP
jgi:uncharacterized repeat protein (TIGR03803 family)